jgi:hypothetical protein
VFGIAYVGQNGLEVVLPLYTWSKTSSYIFLSQRCPSENNGARKDILVRINTDELDDIMTHQKSSSIGISIGIIIQT